tara:strand:+ start:184 stop:417 length:234 start_codon:yes stop_codon:yes gene_type:complete
MFGKRMTFNTEVTNGSCPVCKKDTIFVSIYSHVYRCMNCGVDTEQKVNGVISFMPLSQTGSKIPIMEMMQDDGSKKA